MICGTPALADKVSFSFSPEGIYQLSICNSPVPGTSNTKRAVITPKNVLKIPCAQGSDIEHSMKRYMGCWGNSARLSSPGFEIVNRTLEDAMTCISPELCCPKNSTVPRLCRLVIVPSDFCPGKVLLHDSGSRTQSLQMEVLDSSRPEEEYSDIRAWQM